MISILGSTGSIGTQALDVIRGNRDKFSVAALSCASSIELLCSQIEEFKPQAVCVAKQEDALQIQRKYGNTEVYYGRDGLLEIASMEDCDMVLNSLMGMKGLEPTIAAAEAGKNIAFANKETLVAGGEQVMRSVKKNGVRMLPVDSEHSAIFQCLEGNSRSSVRRIILTASGGPFRGYSLQELENVTLAQALRHPNWSMGKKITIDSASMVNKGLEIIEARWLFDIPAEDIQVVVHPQSVLHSAVEYADGSVIGQMGNPDMRVPIAYAFSYPERLEMLDSQESLDFFSLKEGMTFYPADRQTFKTIDLAYDACRMGGSYPVALNGANEVLVDMFLHEKIRFIDIQNNLMKVMENHRPKYNLSIGEVLEEDMKIREEVRKMML